MACQIHPIRARAAIADIRTRLTTTRRRTRPATRELINLRHS
jgi:hypothetical protein